MLIDASDVAIENTNLQVGGDPVATHHGRRAARTEGKANYINDISGKNGTASPD